MKIWTVYNIVDETNRYYTDSFCENNSDTFLPNLIYYKSWKGLNTDNLKKFIALTTFYFGVVQKRDLKFYWLTDSVFQN